MSKSILPSASKSLSKVQREFERWRHHPSRHKRTRVPEHLWEMACILAQEIPPELVASRLKIGRDQLLGQIHHRGSLGTRTQKTPRAQPTFVQVNLPKPQRVQHSGPRIELEWLDARGRSVWLRSTVDVFRSLLFEDKSESTAHDPSRAG